MDLIEWNGVYTQSAQASVESTKHAVPAQVAAHSPELIPHEATLCGDYNFMTSFAQSVRKQLLSTPEAVHIRNIEEINSAFECCLNCELPFTFIQRSIVIPARRPASESDARDGNVTLAEASVFHLAPHGNSNQGLKENPQILPEGSLFDIC